MATKPLSVTKQVCEVNPIPPRTAGKNVSDHNPTSAIQTFTFSSVIAPSFLPQYHSFHRYYPSSSSESLLQSSRFYPSPPFASYPNSCQIRHQIQSIHSHFTWTSYQDRQFATYLRTPSWSSNRSSRPVASSAQLAEGFILPIAEVLQS